MYISSDIPGKPCSGVAAGSWLTVANGTVVIPADLAQLPNSVTPDNALPLGVCYLPKGMPLSSALTPAASTTSTSRTPLSDYVLLVDPADCADGVVAAGPHPESERLVTLELSRPAVTLVRVKIKKHHIMIITISPLNIHIHMYI